MPVPPHQRAEDLRRQLAEQVLGPGQFDNRPAISMARSKLAQSTSQ
jgi:hypothetical protein